MYEQEIWGDDIPVLGSSMTQLQKARMEIARNSKLMKLLRFMEIQEAMMQSVKLIITNKTKNK